MITTDCEFEQTLKGQIFFEIWQRIAKHCLREIMYKAGDLNTAGLDIIMPNQGGFFQLELTAHKRSHYNLLKVVLSSIQKLEMNDDQFMHAKNQLREICLDEERAEPFVLAA